MWRKPLRAEDVGHRLARHSGGAPARRSRARPSPGPAAPGRSAARARSTPSASAISSSASSRGAVAAGRREGGDRGVQRVAGGHSGRDFELAPLLLGLERGGELRRARRPARRAGCPWSGRRGGRSRGPAGSCRCGSSRRARPSPPAPAAAAACSACWAASSRSSSRARSTRIALSRFCSCDFSSCIDTTSPVGLWVMRTAESVVFTDCPPGPDER